MSSTVTHELLTPLMSVVLIAESLQKKLCDQSQIKQTGIIIDTTSYILSQVRCFLDRNVIEQGKFQPHFEKTTIHQLVF